MFTRDIAVTVIFNNIDDRSLEFVFYEFRLGKKVSEILCQVTDKITAKQGRRFYGASLLPLERKLNVITYLLIYFLTYLIT